MEKEVFEIDVNGFVVGKQVVEFNKEGNSVEKLAENIVTDAPPGGLYRAKWTGVEWVEDMSEEEIDELNNQPRELTLEERTEAIEMMLLEIL